MRVAMALSPILVNQPPLNQRRAQTDDMDYGHRKVQPAPTGSPDDMDILCVSTAHLGDFYFHVNQLFSAPNTNSINNILMMCQCNGGNEIAATFEAYSPCHAHLQCARLS